eukprot:12925099-Prorocentrum_lima.AAC.1
MAVQVETSSGAVAVMFLGRTMHLRRHSEEKEGCVHVAWDGSLLPKWFSSSQRITSIVKCCSR